MRGHLIVHNSLKYKFTYCTQTFAQDVKKTNVERGGKQLKTS